MSSSRKRPAASQVPGPLGPLRPLDRPPEGLPIVQGRQAPREIPAEELQGIGPGSARDILQAEAQPCQVLGAPPPRDRMPQVDADEVDQAQSILVVEGIRADEDVGGLQVPMGERPLVEGPDQPGQRGREAANARPTELGRKPRQDLTGVGRQVDGRLFLDGDQVGLVGQEPEERVAPERPPSRQEREVLRRRDARG